MKLADIARAIDGRLIGDGDIEIARLVPPGEAEGPADLTLMFARPALDPTLASPGIAALVAAGLDIPAGALVYIGISPNGGLPFVVCPTSNRNSGTYHSALTAFAQRLFPQP